MPRFYVLLGLLTAAAVYLMTAALSRHDTGAAWGWGLGVALGLAMLVAPLVIGGLMRRVRPASRRGRHAER
jgi:peptidoglycan/LPS O-acetylase OafA/YrhL